ncbi:MAG: hypothetical protein U0R50_09935 [Gaiellales bacterium]
MGLVLVVALALVPAAVAGSGPTGDVYGGQAGPTQQSLGNETTVKPESASAGGTLPFTGVDLGLIVVAGVGLVVMGASLRRIARGSDR